MTDINVNEWIYYYFSKNEQALPTLIEHFRPMAISISKKKLCVSYFEYYTMDDYFAMVDTVLVECLESYRYDFNLSFVRLYYRAINNRIIDMLRKFYRYYYETYFCGLNFDSRIDEDDDFLIDKVYNSSHIPMDQFVLETIHVEYILDLALNELSEIEYSILEYRYAGYSSQEISVKLNVSKQLVHYYLKKIRNWINHIDKDKNIMIN